jgi:hypothetical protein
VTRYFYDLEFIQDGKTIDLISIGIVADDGREYYAVASDAPWDRIIGNDWLVKNVVSQLPIDELYRENGDGSWTFSLNTTDTRVKPRWCIANEVREFLCANPGDIELWAWYGAYDHVGLMNLWGPMIGRPDRLPMWTHDINQFAECVGIDGEMWVLPEQADGQHDALADARHVKVMWDYLAGAL